MINVKLLSLIASSQRKKGKNNLLSTTLSSGHIMLLPVGQMLLEQIVSIVKKHMDPISIAVTLPSIQSSSMLEATGRLENFGDSIYMIDNDQFFLAPTCEEAITVWLKSILDSYKVLPVSFYQISTKYRKEARSRGGLLRTREFLMKDSYSFHQTSKSLEQSRLAHHQAYTDIFAELDIPIHQATADPTAMLGLSSTEWCFSHKLGDDIIVSQDGQKFYNKELVKDISDYKYQKRVIELGHTFDIGQYFSKKLNLICKDSQQKYFYPLLGCYGMGISRLLECIGLRFYKDDKLSLPKSLNTFHCGIMFRSGYDDCLVQTLRKNGFNTLVDSGSGLNVSQCASWFEHFGCRFNIIVNTSSEAPYIISGSDIPQTKLSTISQICNILSNR